MAEESVEVEFREGKRWVPGYIALQLPPSEELITMSYANAMDYINNKQFSDYANAAQQRAISSHFERQRRP